MGVRGTWRNRAKGCPGPRRWQALAGSSLTGFGTVQSHVPGGPQSWCQGVLGCSSASHGKKGPGCPCQPSCCEELPPSTPLPRTGVVAGDTGGTAKHLPEQGGILLPVLDEDILQRLRPVQLIEDDSGCGRQELEAGGWQRNWGGLGG